MDKAYEDDLTRYIVQMLNFSPIISLNSNRKKPWNYNHKILYKQQNQIERLFHRLDGFRCVFVRFEKLDSMYMGFTKFALFYVTIK